MHTKQINEIVDRVSLPTDINGENEGCGAIYCHVSYYISRWMILDNKLSDSDLNSNHLKNSERTTHNAVFLTEKIENFWLHIEDYYIFFFF